MTIKKLKLKFKLLIYDIETPHLKARMWSCGEQVVRHDQLLPSANKVKILTISYKWYGENKIHVLDCGNDGSKEKEMLEKFDEVIKKADVVIGKNNHRFDNKKINTLRLLHDGAPMPEWYYKSDDLESQIRKYFSFPSYSLDYLSNIFGQGGKMKMERQDWIDIEDMIEIIHLSRFIVDCDIDPICKYLYNKTSEELLKKGKKAFTKMKFYNQKDVKDTEALLQKVLPHIQLKYNAATKVKTLHPNSCITCGSTNTAAKEIISRGTTQKREFYCMDHGGYAGSRVCFKDAYSHYKYKGPMGK